VTADINLNLCGKKTPNSASKGNYVGNKGNDKRQYNYTFLFLSFLNRFKKRMHKIYKIASLYL
jgi:hypothetical protein